MRLKERSDQGGKDMIVWLPVNV